MWGCREVGFGDFGDGFLFLLSCWRLLPQNSHCLKAASLLLKMRFSRSRERLWVHCTFVKVSSVSRAFYRGFCCICHFMSSFVIVLLNMSRFCWQNWLTAFNAQIYCCRLIHEKVCHSIWCRCFAFPLLHNYFFKKWLYMLWKNYVD